MVPRWSPRCFLPLAAALVIPCPEAAATAAATTTLSPVTIQAMTGNPIASYDRLQEGRRSFERHHALAPSAQLRFVTDDSVHDTAPDLRLQFLSDQQQLDIPLDHHKSFELAPPVPAMRHARLLADRPPDTLQIHPLVRNAADDSLDTRLGNLRLECEVSWSIGKSSAPLWMHAAFAMAGGVCHSSRIQVDLYSPRAILSVTLSEHGRSATFKAGRNRHDYQLPLYDKHWSDQALVHFQPIPTVTPSP